ncbi:hypothetical protein JT358_12885 [Micrococcales bacterium 31B]|nr:hypothetical protein [Micrococcales bacterium 31B]
MLWPGPGTPTPADSYVVIGQFVQAPYLWVGILSVMAAWHFSTLRRSGQFLKPTSRAPLAVIARNFRRYLVIAPASLVAAYAAYVALHPFDGPRDVYLLLMLAAMGVGAAAIGALIGMTLPRIFALVAAFTVMGCATYIPVTMKAAWVRSLVGGGWQPSALYEISWRTVTATTVVFAAALVASWVVASRRVSGYQNALPLVATLSACALAAAGACVTVKDLSYLPTEARDLRAVCSNTTPKWCVTEWNRDQLPMFVALNTRIHAVERETGAVFPPVLSQVPPPGPGPSIGLSVIYPLPSARTAAGLVTPESIERAAVVGLRFSVPPCTDLQGVASNESGAGYLSLWWEAKLRGTTPFAEIESDQERYSKVVLALSPSEQGAWANAIATLPSDCSRYFEAPEFDESGAVVEPVTGTGLER